MPANRCVADAMRSSVLRVFLAVGAGIVVLAGCHTIERRPGKSPLKPVQMSPDSVVLDIFFVRFPVGDAEVNGDLWTEVDEQHFPPEVRQRLAKNGFRAGLVAGPMPVALSRLLELNDKSAPPGTAQEMKGDDLNAEPRVVRRHSQVRAGRRTEIQASGVYERLPVLTCEPRGLCGQEYQNAQGVIALKAQPGPDGRVRLDLIPEVHYGESRLQRVPMPGGIRLEPGRPKRVFDELALQATLSPGHLILVTSLPQKPGSLGHYFFTQNLSGKLEQKLMVIRLSQTQRDDLFDPQAPLPLDALGEAAR
ncbi:MAG: hypothetical protein NUV77_20640 [Thermoguttaceae bacterium]|nr:hypothetical protein [Thermoguttaceae bacterium]